MFPRTAAGKFKPWTLVAFTVLHLAALLVVLPYFFSWTGVILFAVTWWMTASLGVSALYHRALTHGSWWPKPWLLNVLGVITALALEMGPLKWAAFHRVHHRESDHENDPHSPLVPSVGFWWAHLLWMLYRHKQLDEPGAVEREVRDLLKYPFLRWLNRNFAWCWVAYTLLLFVVGFLIADWRLGVSLMIWGSIARTVWVWHMTWLVNSATHLWGYRNHKTIKDDSRNLWWVAWLTFGEGWHNNHHAVAGRARFGEKWWEIDATWWAMWWFQTLGWVKRMSRNVEVRSNSAGKVPATSPALPSRIRPQADLVPGE